MSEKYYSDKTFIHPLNMDHVGDLGLFMFSAGLADEISMTRAL